MLLALVTLASLAGGVAPAAALADTGARADSARVTTPAPQARVTLDLGAGPEASFAVERFDLELANPGSNRGGGAAPGSAQASFTRAPGAFTGELARRSATGLRIPAVTVQVLDTAGAVVMTLRFANVLVKSQRIVTNDEIPALQQQRMGLEEGLAQLTTDAQDAERELRAAETLARRKFTSRDDVVRAQERVDVLRTRLALRNSQLRLLNWRIARQGPLEEQVTLGFPQFDIQTGQPASSTTVSLEPAPRGNKRPR